MLKNTYALCICLLTFIQVTGQKDTLKNRLQFYAGLGQITQQDRIFSPMIHRDLSMINAGIEFSSESRYHHNVSLRFSSFNPVVSEPFDYYLEGELKTASPHNFVLVNLFYNVGKTWQAGEGDLSAGLILNADIQAFSYLYGGFGSFGYFSSIGPGGFAGYSRNAGEKGRISAVLRLPFVSLYSRSPYLVNDDEFIENISSHSGVKTFFAYLNDGKWVTWNRLQYFNAVVNYNYDLSERWGAGAAWMFDFIHAPSPRKFLAFRNSLYLSSYFRF